MQRFLVPLVLVVLAAIFAGLYWQSEQQRKSDADAFAVELQDLRERLWAAEARATPAPVPVTPARDEPAPEPVVSSSGRSSGRGDLATMGLNLLSALDQPSLQGLMGMQLRSQLDAQYGELFRSLNLSPDQLDQLKLLLVDRQSAGLDVLNAVRSQGSLQLDNAGDLVGLVSETQSGIDDEIHQLLGDAGFATYSSYQQTLPQRAVVNQLTERLSYTSAPLTGTQQEQMVQILAADSTANGNGSVRGVAAGIASQTAPVVVGQGGGSMAMLANTLGGGMISDAAVNQAQTVLSPPQFEVLQQLQQEQIQQLDLTQELRSSVRARRGSN